jgi:hypothetical protein
MWAASSSITTRGSPTLRRPALRWAGVELAMDLNDDLRHIDGPAQQVDTAAAQAR